MMAGKGQTKEAAQAMDGGVVLHPQKKMRKKRRPSFYVKKVLFYTVLLALSLICVIPLYWMLRSSFMKNTDIYSMRPFIFWPKEMLWSNYTDALKSADFGRYAVNTMVIVIGCLAGSDLLHGGLRLFQSEMEGAELLLCHDPDHHDAARLGDADPPVHDLA